MRSIGLAVVLAFATVASSGCMVGPADALEADDPTEEDLPPEMSEAALSNNARTAFNYFVNKGFTEVQAAGIVGNLMQESYNVLPTAVEVGGGPGRGIAQWSIGGRWNTDPINLVSFANSRGASRWSLQVQLDFIWHELNNVRSFGLAELRNATTVEQAVYVFQSKFERCGTCHQGRRVQYAEEALADYGAGGGASSEPDPTGGDASCYSATLQRQMPENSCVQSRFDNLWYQCAQGQWGDRWSNPDACVSQHPL